MYFKQFYLGCLAHASYMIGSEGEAAVVDPQRDVDLYVEEAAAKGLRIKYIVETHLHADFVSGHRELAARTGAEILFGWRAQFAYPHIPVHDGDEVRVGALVLWFLETPGHTPESISVVVLDDGRPVMVFTGDTLFVGDVGRPDLVGAKGFPADVMAGMLYDSLHEKLLALPDDVAVYPAHGAGSLCGRSLSRETWSTIGEQRADNYALAPMPKEEFVAMVTTNQPEVPAYFPKDVELNRVGAQPLREIPRPNALKAAEVERLAARGYLVLDTRAAADFGAGHVPKSLSIGLGGQFASWAGTLILMGTPIVLVATGEEAVDEAVMRLARVGIETVAGYLDGGVAAWAGAGLPVASVPQLLPYELEAEVRDSPGLQIVDVRRPAEYDDGHVPGAVNVPLAELEQRLSEIDPKRPVAVACASGYRSCIATSLLERHGFADVYNLTGGTNGWIAAELPVEMPSAAAVL
jgi:glyoxylase-like metal-dependent hydrolase (beta-lactamase superfamily II)/rhodanese-related sulfurtransferase